MILPFNPAAGDRTAFLDNSAALNAAAANATGE
jgi:hypothetical protein